MRLRNWLLISVAALFFIAGLSYGRDVTFFVASDLHYGQEQSENNEQGNKNAIALMNNLPGAEFPEKDFGKVGAPRGVILTGDLTDSGTVVNYSGKSFGMHVYDGFVDDYPVKGGDGVRIRYPVFEGYGNHDVQKQTGDAVLKGIASRNKNRAVPVNVSTNGLHYSWDWDDVHFVNLNVYAGGGNDARGSLDFLKNDLAKRVGKSGRPVVILQHYGFDSVSTIIWKGAYWWTQAERDDLYNVVKGYNIAALFTGHSHTCERIPWHGIPDFVAPKARVDKGTDGILVVRMLDDKMIVAQRRLDGKWGSVWTEPLPVPKP
jgi:cytolysin (calcineurin-like family phosphatase)